MGMWVGKWGEFLLKLEVAIASFQFPLAPGDLPASDRNWKRRKTVNINNH